MWGVVTVNKVTGENSSEIFMTKTKLCIKLARLKCHQAIPNQLPVSRTDEAEIVTRVAGKRILLKFY